MHIEKGLRFSAIKPYATDVTSNETENAPERQAILTMPPQIRGKQSVVENNAPTLPTMIELKCRLVPKRWREPLVSSLTQNKNRTRDMPLLSRESWAPSGADIGSGSAMTHLQVLYCGSGRARFDGSRKDVFFSHQTIEKEIKIHFLNGSDGMVYQHPFPMIHEPFHEVRQTLPGDTWSTISNHSGGKSFQSAILYFPFGGFFRRGAPLKAMEPIYGRLIPWADGARVQFMRLSTLLEQGISPLCASFCRNDNCFWVLTPPLAGGDYPLSFQEAIEGGKISLTLKPAGNDEDDAPETLYQSVSAHLTNPWEGEIAIQLTPKI